MIELILCDIKRLYNQYLALFCIHSSYEYMFCIHSCFPKKYCPFIASATNHYGPITILNLNLNLIVSYHNFIMVDMDLLSSMPFRSYFPSH